MALPAPRRPPRSSAIPSSVLRRKPRREVTTATAKVASRRAQPPQPAVRAIAVPSPAPQSAPVLVTVRAAYPAPATAALAASASGRVPDAARPKLTTRSSLINDVAHSTAAAAAGTETLSSSLIGIVSTAAATIAASTGIQRENQRYAGGTTV